MTPDELGQALSSALGASVRLRPAAPDDPTVWRTTALRDHARDVAAVSRARRAVEHDPAVTVVDDVLSLRLGDVDAALDAPLPAEALDGLRRQFAQQWRPDADLWLTRDGRPRSYADLAAHAGDASARWARARSSDGTRIDVPFDRLGSRTLDDPVFAVLLAHDRLARGRAGADGRVATAVLATPMVLRDGARTGRTRPFVLHLEALAAAVLAARPTEPTPVTWTPPRAAHAARIVLASGLDTAGIPAPAQI
ncbi:hypothetical protein [Luteipulveratus halotolerans]|uniref:Uncharacterized protein n=1 Tax=Luteipulveratus halotolerans TaxID=1631356 RepID=A0A0L6CFX3_9MICO|nr:hypothetical protein [Luteipulveratus halotolerans]KNX36604.1 hypothetical protein VV01_04645 [Luteipulveratus halotolerans]